jgi:hypothetical protein
MKPNYLYLYKNDVAIDDIQKHVPFCYEPPIMIQKREDYVLFVFKYFDLRCWKRTKGFAYLKGVRTWQILIEDELYDELFDEYIDDIDDIFYPMMSPYYLCGGEIVKVDKYPSSVPTIINN